MPDYPFQGVYPVLYAFHQRDGSLDHAAMRIQVEHCLANGAHGLMALGLITEVGKHSTAERHEIVGSVAGALQRCTVLDLHLSNGSAVLDAACTGRGAAAGSGTPVLEA